jgi:DUF1680 family protein
LVGAAERFPEHGRSRLRLTPAGEAARFGLKVRVPDWAAPMTIAGATMRDGWATLAPRDWKNGDEVAIGYALGSTLTVGKACMRAASG